MSAPGRITDNALGRNGQTRLRLGLTLAALAASAITSAACHKKDEAAAGARPTPSGLPVPRYVSLRFATVNARGGPGDDYKLVWVYHTKGLPLQVVAETPDWRKVCDPDGGVAWVHKRTLDSKRSVMRMETADLPMRKRPAEDAGPGATLMGRSLADLEKCNEGWCQITARGAKGWVRASDVWGAAEALQCGQASPPPATGGAKR